MRVPLDIAVNTGTSAPAKPSAPTSIGVPAISGLYCSPVMTPLSATVRLTIWAPGHPVGEDTQLGLAHLGRGHRPVSASLRPPDV